MIDVRLLMWEDVSKTWEKVGSDTLGKSLVTIDLDHYLIHTGDTWIHSDRVSVTNGSNFDVLIKNGTTGEIHLKDFSYTSSVANSFLTLYSGTTVSANGTQKTYINKNLNMQGNTPYSTIYQGPTVTAVGTILETFADVGNKQEGGSVPGGGDEWVIPVSTNILLRYTNNGPGTDTVTFSIKVLDVPS